jgi:UDP-N-acetylmuramoylalanine--D-glutamate ligase
VVLLSGTGTEALEGKIQGPIFNDFQKAVKYAFSKCKHGDILLFSPAFASFGMFKNEYDRGDKFIKIIKKLR